MSKYWKIPRRWPKSTIFILGGGPTLLDTLAGRELWQYPVIGVNDAYQLGEWVDVSLFDARWYWWNRVAFAKFNGWKITVNNHPYLFDVSSEPNIKVVGMRRHRGLDDNPRYLAFNMSTGAAAINLAYHLGAKEVVLLGFDMRRVNDHKNWCPDRQEATNPNPYPKFLTVFPGIKAAADRLGLQIVNATPGSALKCFPFVRLEDYP